mmetsp:Transcript_24167/g.66958  ORF Transcript_24167/g.66958 Transcript_24167/m.66958 type:complete len:102 (-) Transcript_24167:2805-3110(-)
MMTDSSKAFKTGLLVRDRNQQQIHSITTNGTSTSTSMIIARKTQEVVLAPTIMQWKRSSALNRRGCLNFEALETVSGALQALCSRAPVLRSVSWKEDRLVC